MDPISAGRAGASILEQLIPPDNGDQDSRRWRYIIAVFVGVNSVATVVHILWACGWLTMFGAAGFVTKDAYADDGKRTEMARADIVNKVEYVQRAITSSLIKEAMKTRCMAIAQNNQPALDAANAEMGRYSDQYYTLFGRPFVEQPCSVVLVSRVP